MSTTEGRTAARTGLEVLTAVLALLTGWVALFGWRGLVEQPGRFQLPALLGGALMAGLGLLLRDRHWRWWQVGAVQLVVLGLFVDQHVSGDVKRWWLVPTWRSVTHTVDELATGVRALSTEYSPVPANFTGTAEVLLVGSLLLLLAIDVLACGLRRVPLAGLPVLVVWMFPISLLTAGLGWPVFALSSLLFVLLLATEETRRVLTWGRGLAGGPSALGELVSSAALRSRALGLGAVTCVAAVLLAAFVPLADRSFGSGQGEGDGPGDGRSGVVSVHNPLVDLHRDLVQPDTVPLVEADTDAPDTRYLRLTVLDVFSGAIWRPSPRQLSDRNIADGEFPHTPGLSNRVPGRESHWKLRLLPGFETSWLPTPYPIRSMRVRDTRWRYDSDTQDVAERDGKPFSGSLQYDAVAFDPEIAARELDRASTPPDAIRDPMTRLPSRLPAVITQTARRVTAGAKTDYQRAQMLQDWLRSDEFTYSTDRAPGSGLPALVRFLTTEKVGYCEQFAAAFGVLARSLEMPTRVVVGFLKPERVAPGAYVYTSDNLHAWPEVYFTGFGWVGFEPTPGAHTGAAPAWTTADVSRPDPSTGPTAQPTTTPSQAPRPEDRADAAGKDGGGVPVLPLVGLLVVVLIGSAAAPVLLRRGRRASRLAAGPTPAEVAAGLWAELRASVHDLGLDWPEGRSPRQQARVLLRGQRPDDDLATRVEALVQFVEQARYARPFTWADDQRASYARTVRDWVALLAASVPPRQARRARLLPRSVWSEPAPPGTVDVTTRVDGAGELEDVAP